MGKRFIYSKAVRDKLMKPESVAYLKNLWGKHIHIGSCEESIIEGVKKLRSGNYPWFAALWANIYSEDDCTVSHEDKKILLEVFSRLNDFHISPWVKHKMYSLKENCIAELAQNKLPIILIETNNFFVFRAVLYMLRMIEQKMYATDDYCLKLVPFLKEYVNNS